VLVEGQNRIAHFILATYRKKDASLTQFFQIRLKPPETFPVSVSVQNDPVHSVVADNPTPEGIVEIEHNALDHPPVGGHRDIHDVFCRRRQVFERTERLGQVPEAVVKPVPPSYPRRHRLDVVD
jgi:hypothetical protein